MVKYLFLILCLILCACDVQAPSGRCINPPEVSKDTLAFNVFGGVDSVSLNSRSWNFNDYYFFSENCNMHLDSDSDYCADNYCSGRNEVMRVECSWFELQKTDNYTITVFTNQNNTQKERDFQIYLLTGNCGTSFAITQSAE